MVDNPARMVDSVTVEVGRGPMTELEAIRHILDSRSLAHTGAPNRVEEALVTLRCTPAEIQAAKDLP